MDAGLRKLFRKHLPLAHWSSVESPISIGIPDSHYCFEHNHCGWVEFKKCAHNKVGIWPSQIAWHEAYHRHGGHSFIAVRLTKTDQLFLFSGQDIRALALTGIKTTRALYVSEGRGPARWDWARIAQILQ